MPSPEDEYFRQAIMAGLGVTDDQMRRAEEAGVGALRERQEALESQVQERFGSLLDAARRLDEQMSDEERERVAQSSIPEETRRRIIQNYLSGDTQRQVLQHPIRRRTNFGSSWVPVQPMTTPGGAIFYNDDFEKDGSKPIDWPEWCQVGRTVYHHIDGRYDPFEVVRVEANSIQFRALGMEDNPLSIIVNCESLDHLKNWSDRLPRSRWDWLLEDD